MQPIYRGNDPGRKPLWVAIGVLAFLVVVLAVALLGREMSRPSAEIPSPPPESRREPAPMAPPAEPQAAQPTDTAPIVVAGQGGESCEPDNVTYDVTVTAVGERISSDATDQPVYLQDWERVVRKYYLDLSGVPATDRQRLSRLLTVGQHLKVRYVTCGSGGFRYLTFVQPMAAG